MPGPSANPSSLPPASNVGATPPTGRSLSRRLVPAIISVTALVVSILAFLNQRSAGQAAMIANQQADAVQVTYWILPAAGNVHHEILFVQNRGTAPISEVSFGLSSASPTVKTAETARYGSIAPCTILKADLSSAIPGDAKSYIRFTDVSGLTWIRTSWGQLNMVPASHDNASSDHVLIRQRQFLPVKGCL
jgi:hypothetical protein